MMVRNCLMTLVLLVFSSAAFAGSCSRLMNEVDAALEDAAVEQRLSDDELMRVRKLREEGEEAHRNGNHAESVEALKQARDILGIS